MSGEFISKWKIHLLFGGTFLAAIAFSIVMNMVAGEHLVLLNPALKSPDVNNV